MEVTTVHMRQAYANMSPNSASLLQVRVCPIVAHTSRAYDLKSDALSINSQCMFFLHTKKWPKVKRHARAIKFAD